MTKAELVEAVAIKTQLTKKSAGEFIELVFEEIAKSMRRGERMAWPDFGVFETRTRKARKIRNPVNNEIMHLKKSKTVGFRASGSLKRSLNHESE